jgi:small subunit ribosomal protein S7
LLENGVQGKIRRATMSARSKVWGACRTLAVRAGPAAPRTQQISFPLARRQWYSSDESRSNKTPPPPPEVNAADYLKPEKSDALPSTHGTSTAAVEGQGLENSESPIDKLDEAELERIFYGGRVAPQDGEPGLTEAQEEALYSGGSIVPADQAEALVAAAAQQSVATADAGDILDSPGHKYPLPTRPYPADFNHKKRYHPVLDQMIRLMMRDGKLSVAQRVGPRLDISFPRCTILGGTANLIYRTWQLS